MSDTVLRIVPSQWIIRRPHRMIERHVYAYRRQWMIVFSGFFEPLFYLLTALVARVTGHVLATNLVLCVALQAVAAAGVYWLAARASGSRLVGVAAACAAIRPPAPGRFRTTICCFQSCVSLSATIRVTTSGLLPAAAGVMKVTGLLG